MAKTILAYHFLKDDMTAASGNEPAWTVGEKRALHLKLLLCSYGYHSSPTLYDALQYAQGNVACLVEIPVPTKNCQDDTKQVTRWRKLLAAVNIERELRLWACDCAERALLREREHGREPDKRSCNAIEVARAFAEGKASNEELDAASAAAWAARDAARDAASAAAWAAASAAASAARDAARDAAWDAASAAARDASAAAWAASAAAWAVESAWQKQHLQEMIQPLFDAQMAEL